MDAQRFDQLARTFAATASRRWVLRSVLGGAVAGAAALLRGGVRAQDDCRRERQRCPHRDGPCCGDLVCTPVAGDDASRCCPPGAAFCQREGECVPCPGGEIDPRTCECAEGCPAGTVDCGGGCVPACGEGQVLDVACACECAGLGEPPCGGACCAAGETCVEDTCAPPAMCAEPSACGARRYCDDERTCICARTPEGDLRCGRLPTTCNVQLCTSSADCESLGPGHFCDTPGTGCCDDQQRCLAPCDAPPCPPERACGGACCLEGEICAVGSCVAACADEADCDGGECQNGACVPAVSCPDCGACEACDVVDTGEIACEGETCTTVQDVTCVSSCGDVCATASLCEQARLDPGYVALQTALGDRGFERSDGPEARELYQSGGLLRTVLSTGYSNLAGAGETALLLHGTEATGETWRYALLLLDSVPNSAFIVGPDGSVVEEFPPTASGDPSVPTAASAAKWGRALQPVGGGAYCTPCRIVCSLAGTYGCAFALAAMCGPGAPVCLWVFRGACSVISSGLACPLACASFCDCRECRDELCEICLDGECVSSCRGGQMCQNGQCVCREGLEECGGRCVDTESDTQHCGGCDSPCGINELCVGGECSCGVAYAPSAGRKVSAQPALCCPPEQEACVDRCCPEGLRCCAGECRESCGGEQVYCNCNQTCYDDVQVCLSECRAGLGCFTGICGPAEPGQC